MRFRADRDELAGALAWAARALPARPAVPVLAGMVIDAGETLRLSCFDYEVSAQASIGYRPGDTGRALVPGRLLSDIVRSLPAGPLDLSGDAANVTVTGAGTTFTLPALPIEDHPLPPAPPPAAGTIDGAALAAAVARVAPAAGRDETLPMLTGVRLELTADTLTLACTDRYRIAVCDVPFAGRAPATALVPARALADAVKPLAACPEVRLALGDGVAGLDGGGLRTTIRLLDDRFIDVQAHFAAETVSSATLPAEPFAEAVKRVALVAGRQAPVRLAFAGDEVRLEAGAGDEARAVARLGCEFTGETVRTAFNPGFLLDAVGAVRSPSARLEFTAGAKRAMVVDGDYRCVLMPVRLAS